MDVQIYTTPTCGYCVQAKNWINEHGIDYVEHQLASEEEKLEFYQRVNDAQEQLQRSESAKQDVRLVASVPQIFVNGERIGGYAGLLENSEKILKKRGGSLTRFSEAYKPFYFPWAVDMVTKHEKIPIPTDWVVTIVEPIDKIAEMYKKEVLKYGTSQGISIDQQADSDQSD